MESTVQSIFREGFADYCRGRQVPRFHRRAAAALSCCGTGELGAHLAVCEAGHVDGVYNNSCRHRACPRCNGRAKREWLERTLEQLLPCPHFHLIFTLPSELHPLWHYNRRLFGQGLFRLSAEALREMLRDERHLGAEVGILTALHSWGRSLAVHPHVHCLVSAGGLDADGDWRAVEGGYLLPVRALMPLFRGKFLAWLRRCHERNKLVLPPDWDAVRLRRTLNRLGRVKWNVHVRSRYAHGRGVLLYLARYVRGGPIKDRQLSAEPGQVRFAYHDHRLGRTSLQLTPQAFIKRLLMHVPVPGMHGLRRYGLYAHGHAALREKARAQLPAPSRSLDAPPTRCTTARRRGAPRCCKHCGATLRYRRLTQRARPPPPQVARLLLTSSAP